MGAGPGSEPLYIDVDSTICQTYGVKKEGAGKTGYTGQKGYHPLLATRGGTGEVIFQRLRGGTANTGRGSSRFVAEAISRARYAGADGPITGSAPIRGSTVPGS